MVILLIFSSLAGVKTIITIMITESKVIEIFCIADDFCKEFDIEVAKKSYSFNFRCPETAAQTYDVRCRGYHNSHMFPLQLVS